MKAVRVHKVGGPEVLSHEEMPVPEPKAGEARVKIEASGVNYSTSISAPVSIL